MTENFIKINEMINRDVKTKKKDLYQLQASENDTSVKIINIGQYENIPIVPILSKELNNYKCELLSYLVTSEELQHDDNLKMIGFIIMKNEKIIASLDYTFNNKTKKFEIIFVKKQNNNIVKSLLRSFSTYIGRKESIHLLSTVLIEDVIDNIKIEKT